MSTLSPRPGPARLGPIELRNRIIKAATLEGLTSDHVVSDAVMGSALLREPHLIHRMARGEARDSLCVDCGKCIATIYQGTHCILAER